MTMSIVPCVSLIRVFGEDLLGSKLENAVLFLSNFTTHPRKINEKCMHKINRLWYLVNYSKHPPLLSEPSVHHLI